MVQSVYLVPGFLSSELFTDASLSHLLWSDSGQMIAGNEGKMRLGSDGISPGPPDGRQLHVGGGIASIWPGVQKTLQSSLGNEWFVLLHPWDWRKEIIAEGVALAAQITTNDSPDNPATIVGHSAGGLVAIMAWAALKDAGLTSYVRRIVTLATPFQGSYYPLSLVNQTDPSVGQLLAWNHIAYSVFGPAVLPGEFTYWTWETLFDLFATFPAFYELFPSMLGTLAASDPDRIYLYNAANYPKDKQPSQAWLNYARQTFQPRVANAFYFPPGAIMTCVSGRGWETPGVLNATIPFSNPAALAYAFDGDSIVQNESAIERPCQNYSYSIEHNSFPQILAGNGDLAKYILDPRKPPTPPGPPVISDFPWPSVVLPTPPSLPQPACDCIAGG